jgi:outer membrane protein OmpA-like peptidoglycan-associated protein
MTLSKTLLATAAILALAGGPAAAQMYPGQDVIVNPYAVPASPLVLYPGGAYRQNPSGPPGGTIHLHMPVHHRHVAKVVPKDENTVATATPNAEGGVDIKLPPPNDTAAATPPPDTSAAPAPTPPHHKHSKPVETAAAAPPPAATAPPVSELPMNLDGSEAPPQAPPPAKPAKAPTRVASTEPPPAQTVTPSAHADAEHANLTKSGAVLFESGATDPSPSQFDGVKLLAGNLNAALEAGAARIQIEAYGGAPGDKSSDARRLSLKRALAVRQLLIDDGVPSARIDVRAMGGVDDKGPVDRVDVFVRAS